METKRQRGGQPGNHNAVKHGYYSRELNKQQKLDFDLATGMEGIEEEIALLRFKIKQAVTDGDMTSLIPLSKITYALEKLIRTNQKYFAPKNGMENGLLNLFGQLLNPEDDNSTLRLLAHNRFPDKFPPVASPYPNPITNKPQNEAGLS